MLSINSLNYSPSNTVKIEYPDFQLESNESAVVVGNSGSGKTTLLHLIAGLIPIRNGKIELDGVNYHTLNSKELDHLRKNNIGIVLQQPTFLNSLNLQGNIQMLAYFNGKKVDQKIQENLISSLGISHLIDQYPQNFSSGERQRASIALALTYQPQLLLADEPTANLDDENCENVIQLFLDAVSLTKCSLLIVTHDQRVKKHFKKIIEI